jgi:hypothetical protein
MLQLSLYNIENEQIIPIQINNLNELNNIIYDLFNIKPYKQVIKFNNKIINTQNDISFYNLQNNDMLIIEKDINEEYFDMAQSSMLDNSLLHLLLEVNNFQFACILDTGAQASVISLRTAETLKIAHLIDKTFSGVAKGVGSAKILGNIFNVKAKINQSNFNLNFRVIETDEQLILLGLDFLLSKCDSIDLKKKLIIVNNTPIKFLNEMEIQNFKIPINIQQEKFRKLLRESYDCIPYQQKSKTTEALAKIISNIIQNPYEDKYKSINLNSKYFQENILPFYGCIELLKSLGFTFNEKNMTFNDNVDKLKEITNLLF